MKATEPPVKVKEVFQCSSAVLWQALSNHDQMLKWYFDTIPEFEAKPGFLTQFRIQNESRVFTHRWEVVSAIPNSLLSYRWSYEEYPGDSMVHFSLKGSNPVELEVSMVVVEGFPSNIPEFERSSCQDGWNYFIKNSLAAHIKSIA
ncbi:MAG: SRPBCC domain-containing protein [Pseudohongiellaceae bacterium]